MTPTSIQSALRPLYERFAFGTPDPESTNARPVPPEDGEARDEQGFVRRDEAFYWGWSMNAFL